jgi:hypothetical protein
MTLALKCNYDLISRFLLFSARFRCCFTATAITSHSQERAKRRLHQTSHETGVYTTAASQYANLSHTFEQAFAGVITFPTFSFRVLGGIIN